MLTRRKLLNGVGTKEIVIYFQPRDGRFTTPRKPTRGILYMETKQLAVKPSSVAEGHCNTHNLPLTRLISCSVVE